MTTQTAFLTQARAIYQQVVAEFFQRRNVIGVGIGYKNSEGQATGDLSLIISVTEKLPLEQLAAQDLIPKVFHDLLTDVVETGRFRAFASDPRLRRRPAQPGISVGHHDITAGTLGLLVQRDGVPYILSNNHVLANCNNAKAGDAIYQPGPTDGGTAQDTIATLADFEPLDFGQKAGECSIAGAMAAWLNMLAKLTGSSHRLETVQVTPGDNVMDVALARPLSPDLVTPVVLDLGPLTGVAEPQLGMAVQKVGRTTGLTQGVVTQIDVTVNVDYSGRTVRFVNQVFASPMSAPGDSGSGILDMDRRAVGLLFGGSDRATIFTPIQRILERFNVTLMS